MSKTYTTDLPCEKDVRRIFGNQWRSLPESEIDGAWGIAIVSSIAAGVNIDLNSLSSHLGVDREVLRPAFRRLSMNGIFLRDTIYKDRQALRGGDVLAWCYYAGYASGAVGWDSCRVEGGR